MLFPGFVDRDRAAALYESADVFVMPPGGTARGTRSSGDGSFTVSSLPAGTYEVLVVAPGFADGTQQVTVGATSASAPLESTLGQPKRKQRPSMQLQKPGHCAQSACVVHGWS